MDTIIFESLGGGPAEAPAGEGSTTLGFDAYGFGESLTSGIGFTSFGFTTTMGGGVPDAPIVPGTGVTSIAFTHEYSFGPERLIPGGGETAFAFEPYGFGDGAFGNTSFAFESFGTGGDGAWPPPTFLDDTAFMPEGVVLSEAMELFDTAVVNVVLDFRAAIESAAEGETKVAEELMLSAALGVVYRISLAEGLTLADADTATPRMLERVVEVLLLEGLVASQADAISAIIEALAAADAAEALSRADVTESLAIGATVAMSFRAAQALVEQLAVGASAVNTGTMLARVDEAVAAGEALATELEAFEAITQGLAFVLRLHLDTGEYIAWSIGTLNKQLSKYTNFPFNSFAKLGSLYLGCTDEGVFRLDGEDDAGEDIAARIRGAMTDMGSLAMKRNPHAYLAYSAPTGLILRITSIARDGEKEAHVYRLKAQTTGDIREGRVKLGGGPRSVLWGWEIENVDGGSLDLHALQFQPVVLERKMRGKNGGT